MIRKHKIYSRPRKAYDKNRIEDENRLMERYGLKNKREIWKADSAVDTIRNQAKKLITAGKDEQDKLISRLKKLGFNVSGISDILGLTKEDYLKRRLQSIVIEKQFARTAKGARQLVSHKHIAINGKIVNIPSYIVPTEEEDKITIVRLKTREMSELNKKEKEK